ncbi:MAG: mannose-1-phosphate guanylyltransferase/mannose-6-phosphate isomerase [Thiomicrospira sp.]
MINIILCGGSGTRLWPLSRTSLPKQFVRLFDGCSLFQQTIARNQPLCQTSYIVSNIEHYFLVLDQLSETSSQGARYLLEPLAKNTAPAIALACLTLDPDDLVLVTPSDHLIKDADAYQQAVAKAKSLAEQGYLVLLGITPTHPHTGYGYIEANGEDVSAFIEKPSQQKAEAYVAQGNYYWNAGIFCFKAGAFLAELQQHDAAIYQACQNALKTTEQANPLQIDKTAMQRIPEQSIDYAVMEKSSRVKVVPADIGWSDLGSFDALYDEIKTEPQANAHLARMANAPAPISLNANNNLIVSRERQIALVDVENLLIVDTADALLIAQKGSSQKIKQVVDALKQTHPELTQVHRLAYRPWGTYEVLVESEKYKVKRIVVKPGNKLSLQKHLHRNEHWIIVSGTATVTLEDEQKIVRPNESIYIKIGQLHRLENQGKIDLVMIEVQVGEYTGEDDIIRIEDIYGRAPHAR